MVCQAKPIVEALLHGSTQNKGRGVMAETPRECLSKLIRAWGRPDSSDGASGEPESRGGSGGSGGTVYGMKNVVAVLLKAAQDQGDHVLRREAAAQLVSLMQCWSTCYFRKWKDEMDKALPTLVQDKEQDTRHGEWRDACMRVFCSFWFSCTATHSLEVRGLILVSHVCG